MLPDVVVVGEGQLRQQSEPRERVPFLLHLNQRISYYPSDL